MDRNLAETKKILIEAEYELHEHFPNWSIQTELTAGSPAQMILQKSATFMPDLIVVGPRGLSSDTGSGLGSVSQSILSYSPFPVRVSRKSSQNIDRQKIAICLDGSPCSLGVVKTAALRHWKGRPEFSLLVIADPIVPSIPGRVLRLVPGGLEGRMKGEEKWVKTLAENALHILADSGRTATVDIYSGNPRIMLVNASNAWKADAVFVGANSQQSNWLGCVASAVTRAASCSVEVIPESTCYRT